MPTDTEVEQRMRELEAEVRATRAAAPPPPPSPQLPRAAAPLATRPQPVSMGVSIEKKQGFFARFFSRQTWKTKLVLVGGLVLAGFVTVWIVGKVVKLALYAGVVIAIGFGAWWLWQKMKKR